MMGEEDDCGTRQLIQEEEGRRQKYKSWAAGRLSDHVVEGITR
jgi:hypothetical protein